MIELKNKGDVVVEVADEVRDGLIEGMNANELIGSY